MASKDLLIAGGYGVVGRRLGARLAGELPERVVIAGRDLQRAEALCREIGHGSRARRLDVDDAATIEHALVGVGTVISCVVQRERHLLEACVARGVGYTDVAPALAFWSDADRLGSAARESGACVVLGAGLSPGVSNMMARKLARDLGRVDSVETAIALGVCDEYGPDSLRHVLEALARPFAVAEAGGLRAALPNGRPVCFPEPVGERIAYLFPWSDVVRYPTTLGAATALGRLALDPPWLGRAASLLACARARRWVSGSIIEQLRKAYVGRDCFALVVTVEAGGRAVRMSFAGRHQAEATAAAAAVTARALASGALAAPGVWLPEEIMDPEQFFAALAASGFMPTPPEETAPLEPRTGAITEAQAAAAGTGVSTGNCFFRQR